MIQMPYLDMKYLAKVNVLAYRYDKPLLDNNINALFDLDKVTFVSQNHLDYTKSW